MTILAIDLGNYNIKTSSNICFISTFERGKSLNPFGETILNLNGMDYTMGKGSFDNTYNKSNKDYMPNLLLAISKSIPDSIEEIDLVLGIPADNTGITGKFKSDLENKSFNFSVNNKKHSILIKRVATVGEGISAYYTIPKSERTDNDMLIDIGGRTINVAIFKNKGKLVDKFTISKGMIDLYDMIAERVNKYGNRYKAEQIQDLLDREIIESSIEEKKAFLDYIMNEIDRKIDKDLYRIIFSGGGSITLEPQLRAYNGILINNPLFANVNGNKIIAEQQWK